MSDTLPPLFPMENDEKGIEGVVRRITTPIFEKALGENLSDSMTTRGKGFRILWRPNNYRRQLKVKQRDSRLQALLQETKGTIPRFPMEIGSFKYTFHTKLASWRMKSGVTVQLGKSTLTGIWSQNVICGTKETFLIEAGTLQGVEDRLKEKKVEIEERIDKALFLVARRLRIVLPFEKPVWSRHEDWVKGDEVLDSLPAECIVHDTVFKKVYSEGVEFKGGLGDEPVVGLKNYIKNRALEDVAPGIERELGALRAKVSELGELLPKRNPLTVLKENLVCLADVFRNESLIKGLSSVERHELSGWLITNIER